MTEPEEKGFPFKVIDTSWSFEGEKIIITADDGSRWELDYEEWLRAYPSSFVIEGLTI